MPWPKWLHSFLPWSLYTQLGPRFGSRSAHDDSRSYEVSSPLCTCLVLDYKLFSTYNGNGGSITLNRAIFLAVCSKNDCSATIGITYLHRANFFLTKKEHWKFATWSHSGSYYGYRGALATLFSLPRPRLASMGNRLAICERKRNMQVQASSRSSKVTSQVWLLLYPKHFAA